jgi:sugar phosphate isomerase/epimerase
MQLAFHTNALGKWEIAKLFAWARENRFDALEIGPSIPLDAKALWNAQQNTGVEICCFTYCLNVLDADKTTAATHQHNVLNRVRIAGELGVPWMVTSTGRAESADGSKSRAGHRISGQPSLAARARVQRQNRNRKLPGDWQCRSLAGDVARTVSTATGTRTRVRSVASSLADD